MKKMKQNVEYEIEILKKIIPINTNALEKINYKKCAEIIIEEAKKIGLKINVYDSMKLAGDNISRPNIVASLDFGADKTLGLIAHYDIVPPGLGWKYDPFKATILENKIFGRGTSDNKGAIAIMLGVAKKLLEINEKSKVNIKLLISPEEEVGGELGIGYLMDNVKVRFDEALIVDAGPDAIYVGASGVVSGQIRVKGLQGHAGYPHLAKNAINEIVKFLNKFLYFSELRSKKLSKLPAPPGSPYKNVWGRFSVTVLNAGEKTNVIPGEAIAKFDLRILPDEDLDEALNELREFFEKTKKETGVDAILEDIKGGGNYYTNPDHRLVKDFQKAASKAYGEKIPIAAELGGNDGKFISKYEIPVICFGPIRKDCNFHGVNEFVYIEDLAKIRDAIINYCLGKF